MNRISLNGVVIGNVIDIVSTLIAVLPIMIILISSGPSEDTADSVAQILMASSVFTVSSIILGALCSVLAGYVSARIAKHDEVLNGALSSILCVLGGVTLYSVAARRCTSPSCRWAPCWGPSVDI